MPILSDANATVIQNSQLTDITNNFGGPTGIDILREASSPEAAHDSSARAYSPRCFPGTRKQYIEDIIHWATPALGDTPTPLYWMEGPAGVGKSTIAQTCAEKLQELGALGAAYFFSVNGQDKPRTFFPSIAYQLSAIHPAYRDLVDRKVRHDRTVVNKAMRFQFRYLIEEPLRELEEIGKGIRRSTQVFVDGLDECEGADVQCEIIRLVAAAASDGVLPLRWIFFSRPEPHIEVTFSNPAIATYCYMAVLPISRNANGEIELYLKNGFENILQRRNTSMPSSWPSTEDMRTVVGAADGLFIYATTVLRFVGHLDSLGPQRRLRAIIDLILDRRKRDAHSAIKLDAPFAELDAFYMLILQRIPQEIFPLVRLLLALICQTGGLSLILAANTLRLSRDEFEAVYNHAKAIVQLQDLGKDLELDPTIDPSLPYMETDLNALQKNFVRVRVELGGSVSFYHKSFNDFLLDSTRSGSYCVKGSRALASHYLKIGLDYDRTFCWRSSVLILAPNVPDSASSLSYPYTSELVNSLIKALVYCLIGNREPKSFPPPGELRWLNVDHDFRKHLYVLTRLWSATGWRSSSYQLWGCECCVKSFPEVEVACVSRNQFFEFNIVGFKLMIKHYLRANIIRPYYPNLTSWIKSVVRGGSQNGVESGLYRLGHGEKSIFWYWEINSKLQHYREFRAINLKKGEKIFQEENFSSWPIHGYRYEYESESESE